MKYSRLKPVRARIASLVSARLGSEALAFAVLRGLTMIAGVGALVIVPLRPEHQLHLVPLLAAILLYNAALIAVLERWAEEARPVFLASLAADLALVFLLVWFTGGGDSHFYLLFYLLVALNAYYFGAVIGTLDALLAAALLATANALTPVPFAWQHIGSRSAVLVLLGAVLGHVAGRERAARASAERLNREMEATMARLARAEQLAAVGRMSAKMAHEVRNPLGAINLSVDLLREIAAEASGSEAREPIDGIKKEVRLLSEVTDEYLTAARLPTPKMETGSVNEFLGEVIGFLTPIAVRAGIRISAALDSDVAPVSFDQALLRLAVRNLIKNGIEASRAGGEVRVITHGEGSEVGITILDDGPGIAPEAAGRLLEPFFTTKPSGTGLGAQHRGGGGSRARRPTDVVKPAGFGSSLHHLVAES